MKYLALMPGATSPRAVPRSKADVLRRQAAKLWEVPPSLSAEKAREAIRLGLEAEAGIKLVWSFGRPVDDDDGAGEPTVPEQLLLRMDTALRSGKAHAFWSAARDMRPGVAWDVILKVVNELAGCRYELDELKALMRQELRDNLPVHEQRVIGPVDLTQLHRSTALRLGELISCRWVDEPAVEHVGRPPAPYLKVAVISKRGVVSPLVPRARKRAYGYADVSGFSLGFRPTLKIGRVASYKDGQGRRERGVRYEFLFPVIGVASAPRRRES